MDSRSTTGPVKDDSDATARRFLFLQGPHGPFFHRLSKLLRAAGATVWRVGFNSGDRAFWFDPETLIPFASALSDWPDTFDAICEDRSITDIVLYGDTRPIHAIAIAQAHKRGLRVHVFEEGYLRPYWVTYERDGSNGHSRLMDMSIDEIRATMAKTKADPIEAPAHWGDMRQHIFYGALYHWFVIFTNWGFRHFNPHRKIPVTREARLYAHRFASMPIHWFRRWNATRRIKNGGYPYHLALLQLAHDSSFQHHSPFETMEEFLQEVITGFAEGAPRHHHLVFKAHPLEDGRVPIRKTITRLADEHGVTSRVHYVPGGKLASLLDHARSAVTVNSTAAQQVLWRGLPLKVFGRAVYDKPEFVSTQTLPEFFDTPSRPDTDAYRDYRHFLLETSQIPGGFYSTRGRRQLLRQVVDMMLVAHDPYDTQATDTEAHRQQLRVVK